MKKGNKVVTRWGCNPNAPLPLQQRPQPPIAIARMLPGQRQQCLTELRVAVRPRLILVCRAVHFQELASVALAESMLGHYQRHVPPGTHKLQPFFRITVVSASLSRLRSATRCLQPPVLVFQGLSACVADVHATVLRLPVVRRLVGDAHLAGHQ